VDTVHRKRTGQSGKCKPPRDEGGGNALSHSPFCVHWKKKKEINMATTFQLFFFSNNWKNHQKNKLAKKKKKKPRASYKRRIIEEFVFPKPKAYTAISRPYLSIFFASRDPFRALAPRVSRPIEGTLGGEVQRTKKRLVGQFNNGHSRRVLKFFPTGLLFFFGF